MPERVRVFISYAHELDPGHRSAVLKLARLLESDGIEVGLDRFAEDERRDWSSWVDDELDRAGHVLVVASPSYRRRAEGHEVPGTGRGVVYEAARLRGLMYEDRKKWTPLIIPVLLPGSSLDDIPGFLMPYSGHSIRMTELSHEGITTLIRLITHQPAHAAGPVAETVRRLPPEDEHEHCAGQIDFTALMAKSTRDFTGRGWAVRELDRIMEQPDFRSGYLLVDGEPGSGKSALLSHMVRSRGYPHHFHSIGSGVRSAEQFFLNVYAQLATHHGLPVPWLPATPADRLQLLLRLLTDSVQVAGRVVLVVDALDESAAGGTHPLLPEALPVGAHVIVSARPAQAYGLPVEHEAIRLGGMDTDNRRDVTDYINEQVRKYSSELLPRIEEWRVSTEDFTHILAEHSTGNFMYLVHVLRDIRAGRITQETLTHLSRLPRGLRLYYHRHWELMRDHDAELMARVYDPVLRTLAVARTPIGIDDLIYESGRTGREIAQVLRDWFPFLAAEPDGADVRYRIYHASFRDFLAKEGAGLSPTRRSINARRLDDIRGDSSAEPR